MKKLALGGVFFGRRLHFPSVNFILYRLNSMKKIQLRSLLIWLFISVIQFGLAACATGGAMDNYPMHSFSFDTRHDSPDVEVLDYQYGSSRQEGTHANKERIAMGEDFRAENTSGPMPRGDFLYVKWRIKNRMKPGEYIGHYEDKVDLRTRLPADITDCGIHFVVKGAQLYVYLIPPPGVWPAGALRPTAPARMSAYLKQHQIYPDQPK